MPGIALGNIITSVTRERFFPKIVDNVYAGNVLFERLRGKSRPWTGGYRLNIPTTVGTRTSLGSYSGFDTFSTSQEDVRKNFTVDPSEYYATVSVAGIQKALNKGPEAVVDMIAAEFSDTGKALADKMGTDLYLDGTGNNSKAIAGLQYHIDDATTASTYQGLSRSTYTTLKSTRNAQSGALGFSNLASDYDAAQIGTDSPTLAITTPAVWTIIEALITPTTNIEVGKPYAKLSPTGGEQGISVNRGFNAIYYRGVPIIADEKATSGNLYFINENHIFLYQIDQDPLFVESSKEGFGWTGWKKSQNQNAIVGFKRAMANVKFSLINLGTSVYTRTLAIFNSVWYYGIYDNPVQATIKKLWAAATTEREEAEVNFGYATV